MIKEPFLKDDMLFKPYELMGGYQCKIPTSKGIISVRYGSSGLATDALHPYEVYYPDRAAPTGHQTVEDIYEYIRKSNDKKN